MSQNALRSSHVIVGNTARVLTEPLPHGAPPEPRVKKSRAALSLVVSTPRGGRSSLAVTLLLMVALALGVVLVMSISVSKGQYELVDLKSQQSELIKANQSMEQEIAAKQAPQELAAQAAALGMVPAGVTGQIDVRTKSVSGSPLPASADTKGLVNIPAAVIDTPQAPVPVQAPLSPAAQVSATENSDTGNTAAKANAAKPSAVKETPKPAANVPPVAATPDLNGGTIPGPAQKDS
ncbi:hypothetical protein AS189_14185 [Arthrobacter alpinus]|uniref:Cell division protein FtsL n=1 Tax=Arthrobacter alpinus TaxID=656366 RepID=A0A0S2M0Z4_9MICC|nr:hypothetical protein [Arthrobacter alpinus]ALO67427.1 hypothetical protein AS189_14185 [Arthrobacter alpinus]